MPSICLSDVPRMNNHNHTGDHWEYKLNKKILIKNIWSLLGLRNKKNRLKYLSRSIPTIIAHVNASTCYNAATCNTAWGGSYSTEWWALETIPSDWHWNDYNEKRKVSSPFLIVFSYYLSSAALCVLPLKLEFLTKKRRVNVWRQCVLLFLHVYNSSRFYYLKLEKYRASYECIHGLLTVL